MPSYAPVPMFFTHHVLGLPFKFVIKKPIIAVFEFDYRPMLLNNLQTDVRSSLHLNS